MIRYVQITPRQAVELILDGEAEKLFIERGKAGLVNLLDERVYAENIGKRKWFIRVEEHTRYDSENK